MQKLHLFLTVVAICILIYLCTKEPECPSSKALPIAKVDVPPNASTEVKAAKVVADIKTAQAEAQVAQAQAQAANAQVAVANEKAKDAAVKLKKMKEGLMYDY